MTEEEHDEALATVIGMLARAVATSSVLLSEIGTSRSKYADDAFACYSLCMVANHALDLLMSSGEQQEATIQ